MMKKRKRHILFPLGVIIAFIFEGSVMHFFSGLLAGTFPMVPYLTLLWFVYAILFVNDLSELHLYWWAWGIGIVYDLYYIGVLGIYTFLFPLIVYVTRLFKSYIEANFVSGTLIYLIDLVIVLTLSYMAGRIAHLVYFSGVHFMAFAFGPTILLNLILFLLLYYPVSLLFDQYRS
ncbi:rod shape-determining protein MreD [Fructilactobacillus cliffordii]|uniref:Rod shape-determining protein MreD n=1 Tax=Fructilactobacillus cliffordii TaxID=2940299 RepID=A0A9Q8ZU76_9LACO|nr:rod shape-determining protein MreD [Fructilactobacillus cliffordii]USS86821.1 rod shape-determining protein MreD [Fructilactobacillus cliffordii]USS89818.1 rod shape-determining protein MreD [Fructilactobacillus cliffordii]